LAAQGTVMIQIAAAEVRAEPAVALDFVRSQSALLSGVQGVEVWVRRGGEFMVPGVASAFGLTRSLPLGLSWPAVGGVDV
jgi:hypothetical protein